MSLTETVGKIIGRTGRPQKERAAPPIRERIGVVEAEIAAAEARRGAIALVAFQTGSDAELVALDDRLAGLRREREQLEAAVGEADRQDAEAERERHWANYRVRVRAVGEK